MGGLPYLIMITEIKWLFLEVDKSSALMRILTENGVEKESGVRGEQLASLRSERKKQPYEQSKNGTINCMRRRRKEKDLNGKNEVI